MKITPGLSPAAIRALSQVLAERLNDAGGNVLRSQPGRLFFPKHLHELSHLEGNAPDGFGADYVALAARCNSRASPGSTTDLLAVLLRTVEAEITRARIVEARLIEAMDHRP